jgi:predicted lipid-binding transport protein (Tim44 family)
MAFVEVHRLEDIGAATAEEGVVPPPPSTWEQFMGPMMMLMMLGMVVAMTGGMEL